MTNRWEHWVFLSDEQLRRATAVGTEAQVDAVKYDRKHTNNRENNYEHDLKDHINAAKSELAGKVFLGPWAHWNTIQWKSKDKSDLEGFIDVKFVALKRKRLIVAVTDLKPKWAYLSVFIQEPWFWIRGWQWGHEMKVIEELKPNRPAYTVETKLLHDPTRIIAIAKGRHKCQNTPR